MTPSPVDLPFATYYAIAREAEDAAFDEWYSEKAKTYDKEQTEIAACMKDAGFEWFPAELKKPASQLQMTGDALRIPRLPVARADVEAHGYGLWNPNAASEVPEALSGAQQYLDSLGPDGQSKFFTALYVDPGCGKSLNDAPATVTDNSWYVEPIRLMENAFVGDKSFGRFGSFMSTPDMQALNAEWGSCMGDKGVLSADEWRTDPDLSGPENAWWLAVRTGPDGSRTAAGSAPDEQHSALIGSELEIRIAVADFDCRAQTDYVNRYANAQVSLQASWVKDHKNMLDQMVATWEQRKPR